MTYVRTYPEIIRRGDCGNKAFLLARVSAAGFRTPPGVGIATGYAASIVGDLASVTPETAIARLRTAPLSSLCDEVRRALPAEDLIVRSSAPAEDRSGMPSYGFYESIRCSRRGLATAIRGCLVAAYLAPALAYKRRAGLPTLEYPALLVQQFIEGSPSGIGLASDVPRGRLDRRLLEVAAGPCSLVTSGDAIPTAYAQDKATGQVSVVAAGERFDAGLVERVFGVVAEVARTLGFEAEVEWTVANGETVVLQARELQRSSAMDSSCTDGT